MRSPGKSVFADSASLAASVAEQFAHAAEQAVVARGRFTVALAGGGTPQALYERLAQQPYRDGLPWAHMHFFWGDERCVPPEHSESNFFEAQQALLKHVAAPPANLHRVRGEWEPESAAEDYVVQLREYDAPGEPWPRFDWVLLGLGADGHTASLFPGSPLPTEQDAPAIAVTAAYQGHPANRVTLTPKAFNAARTIAFLVTGANKAEAVAATLHGPYNPTLWPAQRIQPVDGEFVWWLDAAAAARLP